MTNKWINQDSENSYRRVCSNACLDDKIFNNFKQNLIYTGILEHVSYRLGLWYLKEIQNSNKELLKTYLEKFKENDSIGSPRVYDYVDIGMISPTT